MYSVVVLMALTSNVETPDFGGRGCRGCRGCHGCYSSCHGCYSSCHGCYSSCHGCYSSCHGCYSSCHGCHGYHSYHHSCHGCCGGVIVVPGGGAGPKVGSTGVPVMEGAVASTGNGARIEIKLPVAGQVVIDEYTVPHTSDRHIYVTAPLANGEKRDITLKSGDVTKKITVTAGQTLTVEMTAASTTGVASK